MTNGTGYRFEKANRLPDAAAFGRVFQKATRSRDKYFTVLCRDNKHAVGRLGLAIAKKHCRKATLRNRIKRVTRESFRQHQVQLHGLDVVVINQPAAATAQGSELNDSLTRHWQQCAKAKRKQTMQDS